MSLLYKNFSANNENKHLSFDSQLIIRYFHGTILRNENFHLNWRHAPQLMIFIFIYYKLIFLSGILVLKKFKLFDDEPINVFMTKHWKKTHTQITYLSFWPQNRNKIVKISNPIITKNQQSINLSMCRISQFHFWWVISAGNDHTNKLLPSIRLRKSSCCDLRHTKFLCPFINKNMKKILKK